MSYFEEMRLIDRYGWGAEFSPMGDMRFVQPSRLVGAVFVGTSLDLNFWSGSLYQGATIKVGNNQVILSSSTTANSSASLQSVRTALICNHCGRRKIIKRAIV